MSKVLVWDLPTRLLHWLMTVGFLACFGIAQFAGEHSPLFPIHMILGIALGLVVLMRVVWGFVGTRYARFDSFLYGPSALITYMKEALSSKAARFVGHNPGSSYATFAILLLVGVVVTTGLLMSAGSEAAEEVHVPTAYALAGVVVIHVLGVAWHSWRHRENLTLTMVTGWKEAQPADSIPANRPLSAAIILALLAVAIVGLFRNYDREKGQTNLPLLGTVIQLGEAEEGHKGR